MKKTFHFLLLPILFLLLFGCNDPMEFLYVGTAGKPGSQGLYVFRYDRGTGRFDPVQTLPEVIAPNFLAISPSGRNLYSVNTMEDRTGVYAEGVQEGAVTADSSRGKKRSERVERYSGVTAFRVEPGTGKLQLMNQLPAYGNGACHVETDRQGRFLYVSHYGSGSLTVFRLHADGSLADSVQTIRFTGSSVTERQTQSHLHSILVSRDNRFAYAADLGTDRIMIFERDRETGRLTPADVPYAASLPGSGPRHFAFSKDGKRLYLAEELSCTLTRFDIDRETGALDRRETLSTLPPDFEGYNTVADIHFSPEGDRLFVSNRGHNSLAVFSIQPDGTPETMGFVPVEGDHPRNFMVDPEGAFILVANRDTDNITVFGMEKMPVYKGVALEVPGPICLKWLKL